MKNSEQPINPTTMPNENGAPTSDFYKGLTKREHFAAIAMQSLKSPVEFVGEKETENSYKEWAKKCVKMADYLLDELEK